MRPSRRAGARLPSARITSSSTAMIAADGRTIWIRDIVRVVCDCSGKPTALRGAIVDVSDRRRAERARGPVCGDDAATRRETDARLAGAIAHDINNVLFTIAGTAGLALGAPRVPETREALEAIDPLMAKC